MKNYLLAISVLCLLLTACAPGVVATRPADVVYTRPVSPGPKWVWISGDWIWKGSRYKWREGYWHEAKPGYRWKPGYWQKETGGYRWVKGRWQ